MKKKILSVLFALVLALSLCLVTAAPAMAQGPPPTVVSAETNAAGTVITITFDKAMANLPYTYGQFTYQIDGGAVQSFTAAVLGASPYTAIELTVGGVAITYGDVVTVNYTEGDVVAFDGGVLATFADQAVTNNMPVTSATIDLAVNDENPWTSNAFTFDNIVPGEDLASFSVKFENVGDNPGILTFSMSVSENDMAGAPDPNMSADEFASLVYVKAVTHQYQCPADGYVGSVKNDLPNWLAMGMDLNSDGYVSLYELTKCSPIPWATEEGDTLPATAFDTFEITFQLGDSLDPFEAGGAIQTGVLDNAPQGDGVNVTVSATLKDASDPDISDTEESSGNVFQAAGVAGPVLNDTTDVTYGTIQAAINAATAGDTINVAAGTYSEPQLIINKSLTILGVGASQDDVIIQRSDGSSYFLHVYGAIDFTMKNLTIDASGSATTNFVAHISGLNSATSENVTVIGQGKNYTTDGGAYYYNLPGATNVVGGLDLIDVTSALLTNVTVKDVSRNGFSFTNVNSITLKDFTASDCGHSDSTGWAGLALYRNVDGESKLYLTRYGINSISKAPIGVNAHIIDGTVNLRGTINYPGDLSISDVLVPVVAPNTSNSDAFALKVIPSAHYKVYATSGPSQGFASYFFTTDAAIAAALVAKIEFGAEHVVNDLATPKFFVGAGMKIQSAVVAASDGDTINVLAGTYDEDITITKSLTLLGAQADVPIVNGVRAGEESIIRGKGTGTPANLPYSVRVVGISHSNVVVNGFTIENGRGIIKIQGPGEGILVSYNYIENSGTTGYMAGISRDNDVADVTITHNYIAYNPARGIATNGGATTITDNTFYGNGKGIDFWGGDPYSVPFPDYAEPIYPTIISGNTFTNDSTSITLALDECHQSITITGNDITEARTAAIKTWNTYDVDIVNPAIHFNNIWNNEFGINNTVAEINLDALYNYWGDETGPVHATLNPGGQGNTVSDNVLFSPWLYKTQEKFVSDAPCYAGSVVLGNEATAVEPGSYAGGWNSFSTPVTLDSSADTVGELLDFVAGSGLSIVRAQCFDPVDGWVFLATPDGVIEAYQDYEIKPGEGFFIQISTKGSLPVLCSTNPTSPPRTDLVAGWNLVGLSNFIGMTVVDALHNVDYSVVLSASPPNAATWSVPPDTDSTSMKLGEAYWLAMGQPGILFGHTTTPVADDMTWDLNQ